MACIFNLKSDFIPDVKGSGEWELVGFSLTEGGTYGSGGNWPWGSIAQEDPQVDFDTLIQGFYKLNYFVSDPCGGSQEIIVPVVGGGDAGTTLSLDACTAGVIIDIAAELGATFDGGVLEPMFSYSGTGVASAGFNNPNPNTPIGATFDPSLVAVGTYIITLNIDPQSPVGYTLDSCCPPTSAALIITVAEGELTIQIDGACNISLLSENGCGSATFELWKDTGGGFAATGITSLPYQAQEDADWKWVGTGCDCGTVESNIIDSTGCCPDSTIQIHFDPEFCSIGVVGFGGCVTGGWSGNYDWYRSCDNGVTWVHQAQYDDQDFIIVNDDCQYQLLSLCNNGCQSYSNIVTASGCGTGCSGALGGTQLSCVYRVATGLFCDGGSLKLIKVGTGVVATEILSVGNNYPIDFPITSDGDYYASLDCGDGCPDRVGPTFTYSGCGSGPTCNSVPSASVVSCVITASATNCPSPIYTFENPSGGVEYSGPNNSFAVSEDGTWTVKIDGCPDCPQLETTVLVSGCDTSCNCIATISENPCAMFTLSPQACAGYSIQWEFSSNGGTNWNNVGSGGLTYNGTQNGLYRATLSKDGCPDEVTNEIGITCFSTGCDCTPSISVDVNDCEIDWSIIDCVGFVATMQRDDGGSWIDVQVSPSNPYTPPQNGVYRLKFEKAGCNTIYSDPVNVDCVGGFCQITIDSIVINPLNCAEVTITWSGAGGSNVTVQWTKATANTSSCTNASGWAIASGAFTAQKNGDGTGTSTITLDPDDCDTCIRALVDAGGEGCGIDIAKIYAPCCCTDNPTIQDVGENATYEYFVFNEGGVQDQYTMANVIDQSYLKITGTERVYRNGVLYSSDPLDHNLTGQKVTRSQFPPFTLTAAEIGDYYISVQFGKSSDESLFTIPLDPTTAILTGEGGTTTGAALTYAGDLQAWADAIEIAINNYLGTQSLSAGVTCSPVFNKFVKIDTLCLHQATGNHTGLQHNDFELVWFHDGSTLTHTTNGGGSTTPDTFSSTKPTPCGNVGTGDSIGNLEIQPSSHNVVTIGTDFHADYNTGGATPKSRTCPEFVLTVQNYCVGATFLWSTLETGDNITVVSGDYSVVVTCPDGCEYTLNISV